MISEWFVTAAESQHVLTGVSGIMHHSNFVLSKGFCCEIVLILCSQAPGFGQRLEVLGNKKKSSSHQSLLTKYCFQCQQAAAGLHTPVVFLFAPLSTNLHLSFSESKVPPCLSQLFLWCHGEVGCKSLGVIYGPPWGAAGGGATVM